MADFRRPSPRLPRQGGQGSQDPHVLGRPRRGLREGRQRLARHGDHRARRRDRRVRRPDQARRLVELPRAEDRPARRPRRAGCLPGHRTVRPVPRGPRQPPPGRLRRSPGTVGTTGRRLATRRRRHRRREAPRRPAGAPPAPRPARPLHRLPAAARAGPRRRPRRRVQPSARAGRRRDPPAHVGHRLGGHRAAAARRPRRLARPAHRRDRRPRRRARRPALPLPRRPAATRRSMTFSVWAPERDRVRLAIGPAVHDMTRDDRGWWHADAPGTDYAFLLDDDETPLPDPRSRWQPAGVHGPSRRYSHDTFDWTDDGWTGRQLAGGVIYELHVGTFTSRGTFDAALGHPAHLVGLGVDFVEVLPVNAFDGTAGWGYDGVAWGAVHEPYGGPDAFKRFVDACHARGLGVLLDVVYNHLGPSGAYLDRFGPYFAGRTIWGPALNLDGPLSDEVRRYVLDNALSWLRDYHLDGLRLDAVHALTDKRATHILEELASEVDALSAGLRRTLSLIAESDLNDPKLVTSRDAHGYGLEAQWCDDIHHALHVALTGEVDGYYADFGTPGALT